MPAKIKEEFFDIADLRSLLELQREAEHKEYLEAISMDIEERCLRGYAIQGLHSKGETSKGSLLSCSINMSRFQTGDEVLLTCEDFHIQSELIDVTGDSIIVKAAELPAIGPWIADRVYTDFTRLVDDALNVLPEEHLPLFDALASNRPTSPTGLGIEDAEARLAELGADCSIRLNADQRDAFLTAAQLPRIWALQGPPGTGKTNVAVMIAEAFARDPDIRVLVLSLSHAAVENLLKQIKIAFPSRCVAKVGGAVEAASPIEHVYKANFLQHRRLHEQAIYGMTAHSALTMSKSKLLRDYHPEVVIVDEAGQVPLAVGVGLAAIGASLLMLGDQQQLSAIYPKEIQGHRLACSVLEWSVQSCQHHNLSKTHRLNSELARKIGEVFYPDSAGNSSLQASEAATEQTFRIDRRPDGWIGEVLDSSKSLVWIETGESTTYQESAVEVEIIVSILAVIEASGSDKDIAVLSPFRRQVARIREAARMLHGMPVIDTVESMQGQSVDLALISMASSDAAYLQNIGQFYYLPNRWCVAASRAKTKVIFVGSSQVVSNIGSSGLDGFEKLRMLYASAYRIAYDSI